MRTKHRILLGSLMVAVVLLAAACQLLGGSKAERDMSKTLEVYRVLESRYIDRHELDVLALNKGAIQGLLQSLGTLKEAFDPGLILAATKIGDMDGLLAVYRKLEESYFVRDEVDLDALNESAIISMIATLDDPFTNYFGRRGWEHSEQMIEGTFAGIGAEVLLVNGLPMVVAPIPGSPAEEAGLLAGDILIEADGTRLKGLSLGAAIDLIRGPKGTIVRLTVLRPGTNEQVLFDIKRDTIEQVTVRVQNLGDGIFWMRVSQFANPTDEQFERVLEDLTDMATRGIVLDLRNNPGGVLDTVVLITSEFFSDGLVLYEIDADGKRTDHKVHGGGLAVKTPVVVLVNGGSASGSEVLAGALQSRKRATVIGTQTFGKGVVNLPVELSDGSGLYVTIARWFTPMGGQIGNAGITPDIVVEAAGNEDIQLAEAVGLLKTQIAGGVSALSEAA